MSEDGSPRKDIGKRIARATGVSKRLTQLWSHSGIGIHWKIRIYRACIVPILTYGMESAALTDADERRLDAFHFRAPRKIFRIPSTHYTKNIAEGVPTVTNREVGERAGIPTVSQVIARNRIKFLGQVLRGTQEDLIHSSCFTPALNLRELRGPNRRGRPRADWLKSVLEEAWHYASQLQVEQRRQDLEGDFILPHSIIPLRRAAANTQWWEEFLVEFPTRTEEDFDQGL